MGNMFPAVCKTVVTGIWMQMGHSPFLVAGSWGNNEGKYLSRCDELNAVMC
jgi:hypothetical protein